MVDRVDLRGDFDIYFPAKKTYFNVNILDIICVRKTNEFLKECFILLDKNLDVLEKYCFIHDVVL